MGNFDQARVVIKERAVRDGAEALMEFLELGICRGSTEPVCDVQTPEWTYPVDTGGVSQRLKEGRFQIGITQTGLANPLGIVLRANLISANLALGRAESQASVVKLQGSLFVHETCVCRRNGSKVVDLFFEVIERSLEKADGSLGYVLCSRQ